MYHLEHPAVLRMLEAGLLGTGDVGNRMWTIFERCTHGNLRDLLLVSIPLQGSSQRGGGGRGEAPPCEKCPPTQNREMSSLLIFRFLCSVMPFNENAVDSQYQRIHKGTSAWGEVWFTPYSAFRIARQLFSKWKNGLRGNCFPLPLPLYNFDLARTLPCLFALFFWLTISNLQ